MPPIVSNTDIARPPAEVFAYATDPSRLASNRCASQSCSSIGHILSSRSVITVTDQHQPV
jgi:uncharacterized protein YndB with AHSA1/START domain